MRPGWLTRAAAPLLLLPVALGACGSGTSSASGNGEDGKGGTQIVHDAAAALRSVHAYRIVGSVPSNGQPLTLDFKIAGPQTISGTMTYQGTHFAVTEVSGKVYLKGRELWQKFGGDAAANLIGDRWVSFNTSDASAAQITQGLDQFTKPANLADSIDKNAGKAKRGGATTVNGQPAISVTDQSDGSDLAVATTGKAYPLRLRKTSGADQGEVTLSEFDGSFSVSAPADTVDGSQLAQLGQGSSSSSSSTSSGSSSSSTATSTSSTST